MNKVTLRPVAITDLSVKYARMMGDNKIRHYTVSAMEQMMFQTDALELVKAHIVKEEGETEFEIIKTPYTLAPTGIHIVPSPQVLEGTEIDLGKKRPTIIHEFNELVFQPNRFQRFLGLFTRAINNFLVQPINNLLYRHSMMSFEDAFDATGWEEFSHADSHNAEVSIQKKSRFRAFVSKIPRIPFLPAFETIYARRTALARYFAVSYQEGQESAAADHIRSDLRKLPANAIKGHLCPPSIMILADTVGDGKLKGAMFTFVHIDERFLPKDVKLETEVSEGHLATGLPGCEVTPYEIETVVISNGRADEAHAAYLASLKPAYDRLEAQRAEKLAKIRAKAE